MIEEDGFSSFRYKVCIAAEPPVGNPLASTLRTQQEATDSDQMLPQVDNRPRLGHLTKNHLLLALLVLKDGRIPKRSVSAAQTAMEMRALVCEESEKPHSFPGWRMYM